MYKLGMRVLEDQIGGGAAHIENVEPMAAAVVDDPGVNAVHFALNRLQKCQLRGCHPAYSTAVCSEAQLRHERSIMRLRNCNAGASWHCLEIPLANAKG